MATLQKVVKKMLSLGRPTFKNKNKNTKKKDMERKIDVLFFVFCDNNFDLLEFQQERIVPGVPRLKTYKSKLKRD